MASHDHHDHHIPEDLTSSSTSRRSSSDSSTLSASPSPSIRSYTSTSSKHRRKQLPSYCPGTTVRRQGSFESSTSDQLHPNVPYDLSMHKDDQKQPEATDYKRHHKDDHSINKKQKISRNKFLCKNLDTAINRLYNKMPV